MGREGIYVTLIDPLGNHTESDSISKLRRLMRDKATEYDEVCGKNKDPFWYIDDGIIGQDEEFDLIRILYPSYFGLSFLELKNKMLLVKENDRMENYSHKGSSSEMDRYFLFEDGKLVTEPEKIKKVIKDQLNIEIPSMKLKYMHTWEINKGVADFITTPDYVKK
jgi:hypothetical protein